jgi:tripeptidyl-peptidase I
MLCTSILQFNVWHIQESLHFPESLKMIRAINFSAIFAVLLLTSNVDHSLSLQQVENADTITGHVFREKATGLLSHGAIQKEGRASADEVHDVVFVVQHNNVDKLTRILHDVSDPSSAKYGKHLTRAEISDLTANPTARKEVLAHLKAAGASVVTDSPYGDHHITARAPVSVWENMFNTEFFVYSHVSGKDSTKFMRTEEYSVPQALDAHVTSVFNTIQTPLSRKPKSVAAVPKTAHKARSLAGVVMAGYTTPERINLAYGIPSNKGHPKATQAIYEFGAASYCPEDIADFQYNMDIPDFTVNKTIGAKPTTQAVCFADTEYCAEANADLSFMMAISESPTTYYGSETSMGLWLLSLANAPNPPKVISISYGLDEIYISQAERDLFTHEAITLGTMGVSILVASGDDGATTPRARGHPENCMYEPIFPATCPYVTTVGATQVGAQCSK